MTDPVTDQYMRSMGLDPSILGSVKEYTRATDRCTSWYGDGQCARLLGHDGTHLRGAVRWNQQMDTGDPEQTDNMSPEPLVQAAYVVIKQGTDELSLVEDGNGESATDEALFDLAEKVVYAVLESLRENHV